MQNKSMKISQILIIPVFIISTLYFAMNKENVNSKIESSTLSDLTYKDNILSNKHQATFDRMNKIIEQNRIANKKIKAKLDLIKDLDSLQNIKSSSSKKYDDEIVNLDTIKMINLYVKGINDGVKSALKEQQQAIGIDEKIRILQAENKYKMIRFEIEQKMRLKDAVRTLNHLKGDI